MRETPADWRLELNIRRMGSRQGLPQKNVGIPGDCSVPRLSKRPSSAGCGGRPCTETIVIFAESPVMRSDSDCRPGVGLLPFSPSPPCFRRSSSLRIRSILSSIRGIDDRPHGAEVRSHPGDARASPGTSTKFPPARAFSSWASSARSEFAVGTATSRPILRLVRIRPRSSSAGSDSPSGPERRGRSRASFGSCVGGPPSPRPRLDPRGPRPSLVSSRPRSRSFWTAPRSSVQAREFPCEPLQSLLALWNLHRALSPRRLLFPRLRRLLPDRPGIDVSSSRGARGRTVHRPCLIRRGHDRWLGGDADRRGSLFRGSNRSPRELVQGHLSGHRPKSLLFPRYRWLV